MRALLVVAIFLASLVAGCPSAPLACPPGMSIACAGEGGCSGFQSCRSDGSGFDPCVCGSTDAGGLDAAGVDAARAEDGGGSDATLIDAATDAPAADDAAASDDVGATHDGGAMDDAGGVPDAGFADDARVGDDAAVFAIDAHIRVDAGSFDANTPVDAGRAPDARTFDVGAPDVGPAMCTPACDATNRCCGSTCVSRTGVALGLDGRDDPSFANCNACGIDCDPLRASACSVRALSVMPTCTCGEEPQCPALETCEVVGGRFDCRCGGGAGCGSSDACDCRTGTCRCINVSTDEENCGAIGNVCDPGYRCSSGSCRCGGGGLGGTRACDADEYCCSDLCRPLATDERNCGGCGIMCAAGQTCTAGVCV